MTQVFIFNNASRAANYGIGTYVRQISDGLAILPDYTVSFVEMHADTKEFSITEDDSGKLHYQMILFQDVPIVHLWHNSNDSMLPIQF